MGHPLDGIREKITRAEAHLETLTAEIESLRHNCTVLAKKQPDRDSIFDLHASFPEPSLSLSCIISDCLINLRTALDYIVYELATKYGEPVIHNMFPISNTSDAFNRQVEERDRLHDVPARARAIIESLQPYNSIRVKRFWHPLYVLNRLTNTDKTRLLSLTVACAPRPTFVLNGSHGPIRINVLSINKPFHNGTRIAAQRIIEIQADEVSLRIERGLYVAFKDVPWEEFSAETVLSSVVKFIKDDVLPKFEPFFDQRLVSVARK